MGINSQNNSIGGYILETMEGIVLLGLMGLGYIANKDKDKNALHTEYKPPLFQGSHNSVYDVNNYRDSRNIEIDLVKNYNDLSKEGGSRVVDTNNLQGRGNMNNSGFVKNGYVDSISGNQISKDDFLMNDQGIKVEPFFKGAGPRNINFEENTMLMNHQGGPHAFRGKKKEIGQFFELQKDYGNVFGNQFAGPNADQDRYIPGNYRTGELPFTKELVAPIDAKSEINRDIGNLYAQRNSVDSRRTLTDPKVSYGGKILGGKGIDKRGEQGEVFKHLPDRDYLNTADRWLVTMGATEASLVRPGEIVPDTNRQHFNEGKLGPAAPVSHATDQKRPLFKKSTNQQLIVDTDRNLALEGEGMDDDHNRKGYFAYPNERETSNDNPYNMNYSSVFKDETTRLQDNLKATVKETTNYEYSGNAGTTVQSASAQDQYLRADLNPNKEIIAQGRHPTPESTKLWNGMDTIHMDIKKIEDDYFNHRIGNGDKIYQEIQTATNKEYTQDKDTLDNKRLSDRLDPTNLDPFRTNPYTHSLASFAY